MNESNEQLVLRSYWTPVTVLTTALLLFTLALSGLRIREAVVLRDPGSPLLAVAVALGIEGAAGLAAYRVLQLRRREQPLPRYLVGGLLFFVLLSAAAHLDHALRYAHPAFTGPTWLALAWEVILNLLLALAYPSGLLLVGEVLPEHLRAIDAENTAWRQADAEERRRRIALAAQQAEAPARLAEPAAAEDDPAPVVELPPPDERVRGWEQVWDLARGAPFGPELVQQALGQDKPAACQRLAEAVRLGLVQQDGRGRYQFTVADQPGLRARLEQR